MKRKMVAVLITISEFMSEYDRSNRVVFLFENDSSYSLDRVSSFIDQNRERFGEHARVRREIGKFRSVKHLLRWASRGRRRPPFLAGWHGPLRLA